MELVSELFVRFVRWRPDLAPIPGKSHCLRLWQVILYVSVSKSCPLNTWECCLISFMKQCVAVGSEGIDSDQAILKIKARKVTLWHINAFRAVFPAKS